MKSLSRLWDRKYENLTVAFEVYDEIHFQKLECGFMGSLYLNCGTSN
jgi:hypothetical protein